VIHEAYDAADDARRYVEHRRRLRRRFSKSFETWRVKRLAGSPGRLLDMPCGGGRFDAAFVACDRARGMVRLVHEQGRRALLADAFALPFADRSFDTVFCVRLVHHFDEAGRRAVLKELRRVARVAVLTYFGDRGVKAGRRRRKPKRNTRRAVPVEAFLADCAAAGWRVVKDASVVPGWSEQRLARLE